MIGVILFIAVWYALGLLGSFLTLFFWWRDTLDVDLEDVAVGAAFAILGPISLLCGIIFTAGWAIKRVLPPIGNRTIWKRRTR